ncbi:MAG: hypothetical protein M3296_07325, partial [Actinomycetota bacterium]|nr:hypothetical protein [Actinomycetota bacterium]
MLAVAFALGSAALWGLSDFLGGVKSRRFAVPVVLAVMYVGSLSVMAAVVAAGSEPAPGPRAVVAATLAGVAGT